MDSPVARLTLPATIESVAVFRDFARATAVAAGIHPDELEKLDLVLEEILVNVARYAYAPESGTAELACWQDEPGHLRVEIADFGHAFNPLEAEPPDLSRGLADRPIGGLGVFLVKRMVGSIAYRRAAGRNVLSFTFPNDD